MYKVVNIFFLRLSYDKIIVGDKMKNEKISIDDFIHMFATVSFLQEQRCFNIDNLESYMNIVFKFNNEEEKVINNELRRVINEMINNGYLSKIPNFEYLIKINETIPFMEYITKSFDYLDQMIKFLYNFVGYLYLENHNDYHNFEKELSINLEKVYKKERNVK